MLQCLVSPVPPGASQLETTHFALKAQSSTSSEVSIPPQPFVRRLRQLPQFWPPSHLLLEIPSLQRKHDREPERWSCAVGAPFQKDIRSPKLLQPDKFTKCIPYEAQWRNCVETLASNNLAPKSRGIEFTVICDCCSEGSC